MYFIKTNSDVHNDAYNQWICFCWLGLFPQSVERGVVRAPIGSPVYIIDELNVTIDCNIFEEILPKSFRWLHNDIPNQYIGNESSITIAVPNAADINGDNYTCTVENNGFVHSYTTTIYYYKLPLRLKEQCCAFSLRHKLIQSTKEAKTGVRSSLVPHTVLLMPLRTMKCTLVVSQHR